MEYINASHCLWIWSLTGWLCCLLWVIDRLRNRKIIMGCEIGRIKGSNFHDAFMIMILGPAVWVALLAIELQTWFYKR